MADDGAGGAVPEPLQVDYHPITGVPEEFHDYLHKDSEEYKKLKALSGSEADVSDAADKVAAASLEANKVVVDKPSKGKPKKKREKEIVISLATRQRKKAITSVEGLDLFGVKLSDAAKVFGKKFACGSSAVTNPSLREQIDIQGDVQESLPELILKNYGKSHGIEKGSIVLIVDKQRVNYEDY